MWNAWEKIKRRDLDHIPTNWSLEWAEISKGRRIFVKREGLDRERRVRDRDIWVQAKPGQPSTIYRSKLLDRLRRYRGGIENKISIDWEVSRKCRWLKTSMYQGRCWEGVKQTESSRIRLDRSGYVSRGIEKNPKNLDWRGLCRASFEATIELVLS